MSYWQNEKKKKKKKKKKKDKSGRTGLGRRTREVIENWNLLINQMTALRLLTGFSLRKTDHIT